MTWFPSWTDPGGDVHASQLVRPSELVEPGGPLAGSNWPTVRELLGVAVYVFWLIQLGLILFGGGKGSSEPEQLTLF
jgi:hypothetical protein